MHIIGFAIKMTALQQLELKNSLNRAKTSASTSTKEPGHLKVTGPTSGIYSIDPAE